MRVEPTKQASSGRSGATPQVPGIEDEEIQEFFRRFIHAC